MTFEDDVASRPSLVRRRHRTVTKTDIYDWSTSEEKWILQRTFTKDEVEER